MESEITDPNCIVKAFQNNNISIIKDEDNKYYFRGSDVAKALEITNIRSSIQNFTSKEKGVRKVDTLGGQQDIIFLSSHGVYRLLYSSKKKIAENFREWVGDILDDIIFNQSTELKRQLKEQKNLIEEKTEQLEEQQKKLEFYENKPSTHGFSARRKGFVYIIKEKSKPGHYKIGMSYNVEKRLRNLNTASSEASLQVYHEIETYDCEMLEATVHKIFQPFNIPGRREWFFFDNNEIKYALYVLHITNEFLTTFNFGSSQDIINYMKNTGKDVCNYEINDISKDKEIKETNMFKLTRQQSTNRTGIYKGVCWCKEKEKWKAELKMAYKNSFLGYYDTELEAAKVYNDYALYINNENKTSYILNEIQDYQAIPRDIPNESKQNILDLKTSKYSGVSYDSSRNYYVASIKHLGKTFNLGNNKSEIECVKLYNQQALYFNQKFNTNYLLNEIDYNTIPKNIYEEIQKVKIDKKSSKYHGVTFTKSKNKWRALLVYNKKQLHLGFFENELDAVSAYNNKAIELNKDFNCKYKINVI